MTSLAQKRKPDDEINKSVKRDSRLHKFLKPIKKVAIGTAKVAGIVLALTLAPVALVAGCTPNEEIPRQTLFWSPGYMVKKDKILDVSLGFESRSLLSLYAEYSYSSTSPDIIPRTVREEGKGPLLNALAFTRFFLKDDIYPLIVEDNVFLYQNGGLARGTYSAELTSLLIVKDEGKRIACYPESCTQYDVVTFRLNETNKGVLYHELLHDVWFSILTEEEKQTFATHSRLFFSAVGANAEADRLLETIWRATYSGYKGVELDFESKLNGSELDDWANEELVATGLSSQELDSIKQAIRAYIQIRVHTTFSEELNAIRVGLAGGRDGLVVIEGFSYIGANHDALNELYSKSDTTIRFIPAFMKSNYEGIVKEGLLERMIENGSGHFTTVEDFQNFVQYVENFVNWMKNRYPELQNLPR